LFEAAILYRAQERIELTRRLERLGGDVVAGLEAYMSTLATIVGVAPMLGFLGTIIGLIKAFMSWETMGEGITINLLAGGIYEAMITTAAGLSVAIPYYLIYNQLATRVKTLTRLTEERTEEFIDLLTEETAKEPVRHAL
jgi:biopolymer transport protein ExbB